MLLQVDPHCSYKARIAVSETAAAGRFLLLYSSQVILEPPVNFLHNINLFVTLNVNFGTCIFFLAFSCNLLLFLLLLFETCHLKAIP